MIKKIMVLIKAPFSLIAMILKTLDAILEELDRKQVENQKNKDKSDIDKIVQSKIDDHLFLDKLFNEKSGRITKDWGNVRAGLKVVGLDIQDAETPEEREIKNEQERLNNKWKGIGDTYEKYIGKRYENSGFLVIYHGFIRGVSDRGVDLIAISLSKSTRHLIQCKNYNKTILDIELVDSILHNLKFYLSDYLTLEPAEINYYIDDELPETEIVENIFRSPTYNDKFILYIPYIHVISAPLKERLKTISSNRYLYGELMIIVTGHNENT